MKFFDLLALIIGNLARRKGRVALTAVGVIIGTTAVVLLVSLGVGLIGIGAYKNSPSLTSVLQEVVDNGGWTGAGDVAFFLIQNSASGWLRVASWDHATDPPPQLYVEWSDAPSPISDAGDVTLGAVTGSAAAVLPGHGAAASTLGAGGGS